jgi:hypothetical protein
MPPANQWNMGLVRVIFTGFRHSLGTDSWLVVSSDGMSVSQTTEDLYTEENLYLAYRKAKVDVFYERSQPLSESFCDYEENLHANLATLGKRLKAKKSTWQIDLKFIGSYGFIPKGLKTPVIHSDGQAHFSLSDPQDAWNYLLRDSGEERPSVEFRPVALFTVDMYIVCALWVNVVGHKYDACLDPVARGSRLRRLRARNPSENAIGPYHEEATGSFQPYFYCYRQWREQGLKAIRHELTEGRRVVAITMDLMGFYHNVDPRFLLNDDYLTAVGFGAINGVELAANERHFTEHLITAFETWAVQLPQVLPDGPLGVPVGPSAPRVIANVLLAEFDRLILRRLTPVYYGRYVDDVFLVLRDSGTFDSAAKVIKHLARRISRLKLSDDGKELRLNLPYAGKSRLVFKTEKQRVFLLSGEIGEDLLDAIESKIDEVSSEWRLLPNLDDLERSPAARVLTAARKSNEDADSLRKADELSLRRLGFALMLRSVDALVRDLPPSEWQSDRNRFYRFAARHALTPLRLMDLNDYLPRLLSVAVASHDWRQARDIVARITNVLTMLKSNVSVVPPIKPEVQWDGYFRHLRQALLEAVLCAYPIHSDADSAAAEALVDQVCTISPHTDDILKSILSCELRASDLFWSDLARVPFKELLLDAFPIPATERRLTISELPTSRQQRAETISRFLSEMQVTVPSLAPLVFPTRPLSPSEITECLPKTAQDMIRLRDLVQALRGAWVKAELIGDIDAEPDVIRIGAPCPADSSHSGNELSN